MFQKLEETEPQEFLHVVLVPIFRTWKRKWDIQSVPNCEPRVYDIHPDFYTSSIYTFNSSMANPSISCFQTMSSPTM